MYTCGNSYFPIMNNISFKIGNEVNIGGNYPIVVQTMCNTDTLDIESSVSQCIDMVNAGAQMIRLTTQGLKEVEALKIIKKRLREMGILTPIISDIHFLSEVAIASASVADKVRINPGNFAKKHEDAKNQFTKLISICKKNGTAIRIGLNHGSLGERITSLYGNTPNAMKEAVMEWLTMCKENDFYNVVVSLKASNTRVMVDAYRLLYKAMSDSGTIFPLHLGVTEAGNGDSGRIKSAVGLSALLSEGIGDTIRVSLTENPLNEIPVAKFISNYFKRNEIGLKKRNDLINTDVQYNKCPQKRYEVESWDEFILSASCDFGPALLDCKIDDISISGTIAGKEIDHEKITLFKEELMQACRRHFTRPEYIACPGCGRTLYNLEETFNEIKRRTSNLTGLKIAVMGCIVNGPGEMADADYGYVGEGRGKVTLYKGKIPVLRAVPQEEAIDKLLEIIASSGDL